MTNAPAQALGKGFDDPVRGAQRCFRLILSAMSEPGTIFALEGAVEPPSGVSAAAARVLLTLADQETPLWLAPGLAAAAAPFVRFHCGAPIVSDPQGASLALVAGGEPEPLLAAFDAGDERYPDRSATLVVECEALDGGEVAALTGPGIETVRHVAPQGLRPRFWDEVAANNARYPLGVDLILACGDAIFAVPRSSRIAIPAGGA